MTVRDTACSPRPKGLRIYGGGLVLLLALAACQAPAPEAIPPLPDSAAAQTAPPAPDPAVAALPPEPVIDDDPQRLVGIGPGALSAILGEPELVRREPPAEIWQYRNETCILDVILYDAPGGRAVTYVEARDGAAQPGDARACFNTLLRARLVRPLS